MSDRFGSAKRSDKRARLRMRDGENCWLCGHPMTFAKGAALDPDFATLDHVLPKSLGGTAIFSNLKLAHRRCNLARGNTHPARTRTLPMPTDTGNPEIEAVARAVMRAQGCGLTRDGQRVFCDQCDCPEVAQAAIEAARPSIRAEAMEDAAAYIEGKGGVIPGATVFAPLVSGNNQPCMSGDGRDRMMPHLRRRFDDATNTLAQAIRALGDAKP